MTEESRRTVPRSAVDVALIRRSRWPGWIWAIPIAALLIVVWLGIRAFSHRGITVTVIFNNAAGMKVGSTPVEYRGLTVGKVTGLALTKDGRHVEADLTLDDAIKAYLRAGTRFWLAGTKPSLTNLSSLGAIITGPTIRLEPGPGKPARHFTALNKPPLITTNEPGRQFILTAPHLGSVKQGAKVYYLGIPVGTVTSYRLTKTGDIQFDAFVRAPYDRFVHMNSRFWNASAIQISMRGKLLVRLVSLGALVSGAVSFETSPASASSPLAREGARFVLYKSRSAAEQAPVVRRVSYRIAFDGAVGELKIGAPVTLKGFTIGTVTGVGLDFDAENGRLSTPVTIALNPERFHFIGQTSAGRSPAAMVKSALDRLVKMGLRATLIKSPPLIGGAQVRLIMAKTGKPAPLMKIDGHWQIPTAGAGGVGTLISKLSDVPIAAISQNIREISGRLNDVVSAGAVKQSLVHLDHVLAQLDAASHQVGPTLKELRQTSAELESVTRTANRVLGGGAARQNANIQAALKELTEAERSVRLLAAYLDRHPEALIRGRPR
jgi:paraquat-inducible protein B